MLGRVVDRLRMAKRVDEIVIATSTGNEDDAIAAFCADLRVRCFRGPLNDVSERLARAAEDARAEAFVRISGDSPLMSPGIVDAVVALYAARQGDLASNGPMRTLPNGMSAEVSQVRALRRAQKMMLPGEAEHVTAALYRRVSDFRIANLTSGHDWGSIQMSVDADEDLALTEKMFRKMGSSTAVLAVEDLIALRE